ncbi:amino acid permease/ SLC12A domain-containing protein [Aspergillus stella-maris]|uniref:amino acid permease/ SLC12A domain-containing protein n=1 Tax=Aspergillus stella-maris TaxID=1810926 RepID=UPI003CCD7C2D
MSNTIDSKTPKTVDLTEVESHGLGEIIDGKELRRDLKSRHVLMFSIACAIGTGLLIGSGSALAKGGPGSLLVSYASVGVAVFFVMASLGEMAAYVPMNKGFGGYATRMVDPAFGFATGWNYFMKYLIATPTNLTAAGLVVQYWRPDLNVAIWIAVFGTAIIIINLLPVSNFGEMEFWLGVIKVLVMTIVILVCLIIALGGGPNHHRSGFEYWNSPGAFREYITEGPKGRFLGWWACMCQACFAYAGTEVVGMTFGETPNPRKNIPRAVKQTFWRIASFYVIGILVLGMAVPSNDDRLLGANKQSTSAAASPFVVAINIASISVLPDIINASLLVFTLSASSSDLYCASRALYGLAKDGQAPRVFSKTSKSGNPTLAVGVSALFVALAFMNTNESAATVFDYFVSLVTIFAVLNWIAILVSYLHFRRAVRAQNIELSALPYVGILQPYGAYYALFIAVMIIIFNGYDAFVPGFTTSTLILKYLGTVLFIVNVLWWKVYQKTLWLKPKEVDLVTGQQDLEE